VRAFSDDGGQASDEAVGMILTGPRMRLAVGAAGAVALYTSVLRPRVQWLGTSSEERTAIYPGDDLIPDGRRYGAIATTIAAPPERVWPWLVQMGCDRAGFYSFDRLDNGGRPSADRIHPHWQHLREGDHIASVPDANRWFDVALLVPERALVLRASLTVPAARNFDPAGGLPRAYSDSTWGFFLHPTVEGHTRLVVTGKARGAPRRLVAVANWLLWDPAHWVMQLKQFAELRRRAAGFGPPPDEMRRSAETVATG
jgi:proline iminopeptidase